MALYAGQILRGSRGSYKVLTALKAPTVWKAQVLCGPHRDLSAVVKMAQSDMEQLTLNREYRHYQTPAVMTSPFIRTLYDSIGPFEENPGGVSDPTAAEDTDSPKCLVFEWMDNDLRSVPSRQYRDSSRLPKAISKSIMSAIELFGGSGLIHTDVNINNIFLSNVDAPSPVVKLGDLGMLIKKGYKNQRIQSTPCRAPEVWQGIGCFHPSDVWSVGTTLARWLHGKPLFGAADKVIEGHTEAWCIARLERLTGPIGPCIDNERYKYEFEFARQLSTMEVPQIGKLINCGTWREELESLSDPPVAKDVLDFIEYLLVVDMAKRPTARDAMQHQYFST